MQHTYQAVADNETLSAINNLLALPLFCLFYKIPIHCTTVVCLNSEDVNGVMTVLLARQWDQ